jgi:immune inhibitor A
MSPAMSGAKALRRLSLLVAVTAAVLLVAPVAGAVPPSPDLLARAAHDRALAARIDAYTVNAAAKGIDGPRDQLAARSGAKGALRQGVQRAAPATGTLRTLALIVDFSDRPHAVAASAVDALLFADVFGPASVRGYFREVSYGSPTTRGLLDMVTLDPPTSTGWFRLPQTMAYYTAGGDNGTGAYPNNAQKMVEDAVAAADPFINFRNYDNDGDGFVDNLFVIHAGAGAEDSGKAGDIWSHQWNTTTPISCDGVKVSDYSTEPEYWVTPGDMTTGVYCHEMGHVLGLPDLYDRDYSSAGVGEWSLMAGGSWNGTKGDSPARFDAWSAMKLGWLQPQLVTGAPTTKSIPAVASSRSAAFKLYPGGATSGSEYFLVENRRQTGTDSALPGSGLLIWHVDETRNKYQAGFQNDTETHKLVDLEEAGGVQSLDRSDGTASADDPYPGTSGNRAFSDGTSPNAKTYAGASSGVVVDQIGNSATTMSARLGAGTGSPPPPNGDDDDIPGVTIPSSPFTGSVSETTDLDDVYKIALTSGQTLRASITGPFGTDLRLYLYAPGTASVKDPETPYLAVAHGTAYPVNFTYKATKSGTFYLDVYAETGAGNYTVVYSIAAPSADTVGPKCAAKNVTVKRGKTRKLYLKVHDALSSQVTKQLVITTRSGTVKQKWSSGYGENYSGWWSINYKCRLPKGSYKIVVTGKDLAGNKASVVGRATLKVT